MPVHRAGTRAVRHILVIGCNPMLPDVLDELSKYVGEGSVIHIAAPHIYKCRPIESPVNIETVECDIRDRNVLSGLLGRNPDVIIVLSDHACNPGTADANTLIVLLHLDDLLKGCAIRPTVVSEMQDAVNQSLAACTHVNDLVVGSNMIAQLLTQISESSDMAKVFEALLSDEGSEIHIKPVCRYVKTGMNVTMRTVAASALRYGELFLGYKIAGEVPLIKLNPDKSQTLTFSAGDGIIVLAENDG